MAAILVHLGMLAGSATGQMTGGVCFLLLAATFAVVSTVIFAVEGMVATANRETLGDSDLIFTTISRGVDSSFGPDRRRKLQEGVSSLPFVAVVLLFLVFRARTQLLAEDDPTYHAAIFGMMCATIGLLVLALEGLTIVLESKIFGNISSFVGSILELVGTIVLLWAVIGLRSDKYVSPITETSFAVVAFIGLAKAIVRSLARFAVVDAHQFRFLTAGGYSVTVMTLVLYIYLLAWTVPHDTPHYVNVTLVITAALAYLELATDTVAAFYPSSIVEYIQLATVAALNVALAVLVYSIAVSATTSPALTCAKIFLAVNVVFTLLTKALQEGLSPYHNSDAAASLRSAFASVLTTNSLTHILAVLLMYLHYNFQLIEGVSPKTRIDEIGYLTPAMYLAVIGILIQVPAVVVRAWLPAVELVMMAVGLLLVAIGAGCIIAAVMTE